MSVTVTKCLELCHQDLLRDPHLYRRNRHNQSMRFGELCKWVGLGLWHSLACFYGTYFIWSTFGQFGDDIRSFGNVVGFNVVLVVNLKARAPKIDSICRVQGDSGGLTVGLGR